MTVKFLKSKLTSILMIAVLLYASACSTHRRTASSSHTEDVERVDSVVQRITNDRQVVTVPQAKAVVEVGEDRLRSLPEGASFVQKEAHATVAITRHNDNYIIEANCDSLLFVIENLSYELFRYKYRADSVATTVTKVVEIKEPTGWQWFQIWGFRVLVAVCLCYLVYVLFNNSSLWDLIQRTIRKIIQ